MMTEVAAELVRREVERIASSEGFQNSDRLCRFLRFTVEAKLRGEGDRIKEYLIGREVFDRNGEYDPRLDPIVRVEARRLRRKLDEYYAGAGREDEVRIGFPKGSYAPEFETAVAQPGPDRRYWIGAASVAVLALAGLALFWKKPVAAVPDMVAVVPARWIWRGENFPAPALDVDLAERIGAAMAEGGQSVVAWPSMQRFSGGNWDSKRIGAETGASRVLVVAVRQGTDGPRVTAFLVNAATERKLVVHDQENARLDTPDDRRATAASIARSISGRP